MEMTVGGSKHAFHAPAALAVELENVNVVQRVFERHRRDSALLLEGQPRATDITASLDTGRHKSAQRARWQLAQKRPTGTVAARTRSSTVIDCMSLDSAYPGVRNANSVGLEAPVRIVRAVCAQSTRRGAVGRAPRLVLIETYLLL